MRLWRITAAVRWLLVVAAVVVIGAASYEPHNVKGWAANLLAAMVVAVLAGLWARHNRKADLSPRKLGTPSRSQQNNPRRPR